MSMYSEIVVLKTHETIYETKQKNYFLNLQQVTKSRYKTLNRFYSSCLLNMSIVMIVKSSILNILLSQSSSHAARISSAEPAPSGREFTNVTDVGILNVSIPIS